MLAVTAYHLHQGSIGNLGVVGMLRFVQIQPIKAALILSRVAVKHIATNTYLVLSHVCWELSVFKDLPKTWPSSSATSPSSPATTGRHRHRHAWKYGNNNNEDNDVHDGSNDASNRKNNGSDDNNDLWHVLWHRLEFWHLRKCWKPWNDPKVVHKPTFQYRCGLPCSVWCLAGNLPRSYHLKPPCGASQPITFSQSFVLILLALQIWGMEDEWKDGNPFLLYVIVKDRIQPKEEEGNIPTNNLSLG